MKSRIFAFTVLLTLTLLGFQNCGQVSYRSVGMVKKGGLGNSGNGDGYTGKVYLEAGLCAGRWGVKAKIVERAPDQYYMARENCQDMSALSLIPASMTAPDPATPGNLIYAGTRVFRDEDMATVYASAPRLNAFAKMTVTGRHLCEPGQTVQVAVFQGPLPTVPALQLLLRTRPALEVDCAPDGSELVIPVPADLRQYEGTATVMIVNAKLKPGRDMYWFDVLVADYF